MAISVGRLEAVLASSVTRLSAVPIACMPMAVLYGLFAFAASAFRSGLSSTEMTSSKVRISRVWRRPRAGRSGRVPSPVTRFIA